MALDTATILAQIDDVLRRATASAQIEFREGMAEHDAEAARTSERVAAVVAAIDRLTPPGHYYREQVRQAIEYSQATNTYTLAAVSGVLRSLRADVESGYTSSLVELVHADVFADFLGMASELQRNGFKDAAAVIAGSTLEERQRRMSRSP